MSFGVELHRGFGWVWYDRSVASPWRPMGTHPTTLDAVSVRAGIIVTGTEILTGRIADQNGPWLSTQLLALGVDVAHITICGDRPADLTAQLRFLTDQGVDLIITSGGLGPTADDLTVATTAEFCHRELLLDRELEEHIAGIIRRYRPRTPDLDAGPTRIGIRKQAQVPTGATVLPPTGTAPGVVIPAVAGDRQVPTLVILPGPPGELQAMCRVQSPHLQSRGTVPSRRPAAGNRARLRIARGTTRRDTTPGRRRDRRARPTRDHHMSSTR